MSNFQLRVDLEGAEKLSKMAALLTPKLFDRALKGGVTYAARAVPPAVSKAVGSRYSMRAARIKQDIKKPRFFDGGRSASIGLSRKAPTAAQFAGRQTKRGYSFAIFRGQRELFTRGFIGRGRLAGLPLYRVKTGSESQAAGGRSKLEVIHGPSVGSMFLGESKFGEVMQKEVENRMSQQFITGVQRELARAGRGFGAR
jgi:hypothetical protein